LRKEKVKRGDCPVGESSGLKREGQGDLGDVRLRVSNKQGDRIIAGSAPQGTDGRRIKFHVSEPALGNRETTPKKKGVYKTG